MKKLLLLLCVLFGVTSVWADDATMDISYATGTFNNANETVNRPWNNTWISTQTDPQVTMVCYTAGTTELRGQIKLNVNGATDRSTIEADPTLQQFSFTTGTDAFEFLIKLSDESLAINGLTFDFVDGPVEATSNGTFGVLTVFGIGTSTIKITNTEASPMMNKITVAYGEPSGEFEHSIDCSKTYTIKNRNFDQWACGTGTEIRSKVGIDKSCEWLFIPAMENECYYIQNVATGLYAQSTAAPDNFNGPVIQLGSNPVMYCVMLDNDALSSTSGFWGLASTDQDVYDFCDAACIGWNLVQGSQYVTGYSAEMGVNPKSFWTISEYVESSIDCSKTYSIKNRNFDQWASGQGEEIRSTETLDATNEWQFLSTGKADCYYVKNVATGLYAQSTAAPDNYNGPVIKLGATPVEYCVMQDIDEESSTCTFWGLASTDQDIYDFTDGECVGWNLVQGDHYVTGYNAKMGANPKSFWVISLFPQHTIDCNETYRIKNRNFDQWASGQEGEVRSSETIDATTEWRFIATPNDESYYVQNVATGLYAQSTAAPDNYNGPAIKLGATPVEYRVMLDQTEGSSTYGYYGLCSTDQDIYDFSDGECIGWNLVQNNHYVTGYNAKMGANPKSFWVIEKFYGEHAIDCAKTYTIKNKNFDQWACGDGEEIRSKEAIDESCEWKLEPSPKDNCYFVKNVSTELYAQSTNYPDHYNGPVIALGTEPVEYSILQDTTEGSSTFGFWGLCSTDQDIFDFTDKECVGWNLVQGDMYVTGYSAEKGVNAKSFWVISEYVNPDAIKSVENVANNAKTLKMLKDGKVVIVKNGRTYNTMGMELK